MKVFFEIYKIKTLTFRNWSASEICQHLLKWNKFLTFAVKWNNILTTLPQRQQTEQEE